MPRRQAPFVLYSRGPTSFTVVPRGIRGWGQVGLWLALAAPLVIWFGGHLAAPPRQDGFGDIVWLFCCGMLAWLIGGLWWMHAHAEVVALSVHRRDRQREQRRRQRQHRQSQEERGRACGVPE